MFVPAGFHMDASIKDDAGSPAEPEPAAFNYPAGLGNVLMNGCYGTGYKEGDPCYVAKWTLDACLIYRCKNVDKMFSIPAIIYSRGVRHNNFLDTIYGYRVRYNIIQITI